MQMDEPEIVNQQDRRYLDEILQQMSGEAGFQVTLELLLQRWRRFVKEVERGYEDSIYEYTNDLSTRELLARIVYGLTEEGQQALMTVLKPLDDRFLFATKETEHALIGPEHDGASAFWRCRIPLHPGSELREDLLSEEHE
jgi:hypothetical protein